VKTVKPTEEIEERCDPTGVESGFATFRGLLLAHGYSCFVSLGQGGRFDSSGGSVDWQVILRVTDSRFIVGRGFRATLYPRSRCVSV